MVFKRLFDVLFSALGIIFLGWLILLLILIAFFDSGGKGLFLQKRIGQYGKPFYIFKIRTLHAKTGQISPYGKFLRNYKLDEFPQLVNILLGKMSFVGPRPDIAGYYDCLQGDERKLLELKPGLCSMAALKYYNEEALLAEQNDPLHFNNTIVFPDKIMMNIQYYNKRSAYEDFRILKTCTVKFLSRMFSM